MKKLLAIALIAIALLPPICHAQGPESDFLVLPRPLRAQAESDPYLIGRIAVAVIFPESEGHLEDWRGPELIKVLEQVESSLDWWAAREPRAHLTFTRLGYVVPTRYEPVALDAVKYDVWVADVMRNLGYEDDALSAVAAFNGNLARDNGADFGLTVFVVRSIADGDGAFADGYYMLAEECSQMAAITYSAGPYSILNLDMALAPGIGCAFCALPQFEAAQVPCTRTSGVLGVETQNSEYGDCLSDEPSIMRYAWQAWYGGLVDEYARGQLGWRDSDDDGILDPVDRWMDGGRWKVRCPIVGSEVGE